MSVADDDRVGRYVVREELGRGGMGRVLRAYDPKLHRQVALKEVHRDRLDAGGSRRLVAEARAMAKLSHPNVVAVHDVVELAGDQVVIVMEYVDGETLGEWLACARAWPEIVAHFVQAGRGLAAAHAVGLLHRDFKPDNVLVGRDGRVRVTDFGLAREIVPTPTDALDAATLSGHVPPTAPGAIVGTLPYLAPERLVGAPASAASDQFAFCVSLWEALFGARPFSGRSVAEVAMAMAAGPPTPPPSQIPPPLVETIRRGLGKSAEDRWPDVESLLAALSVEPPPSQPDAARRRPRWGVFVGTGLVVVAALAYVVGARDGTQSEVPTDDEPAALAAEPHTTEHRAARPDAGNDAAPTDVVEVRAAAVPPSATLYLDGTALDGNPAVITLPRGATHRIEARADGYETGATEIVARGDREVVLRLVRPSSGKSRRRGTGARAPEGKLPIERDSPWKPR